MCVMAYETVITANALTVLNEVWQKGFQRNAV